MKINIASKSLLIVFALAAGFSVNAGTCGGAAQVCETASNVAVTIVSKGNIARVVVDDQDDVAVHKAAASLKKDLSAVATVGRNATELSGKTSTIVVGTLGHSRIIDQLVKESKLDVSGVKGVWEAFAYQVVDHPTKGIDKALVIVGSDRRGTVFGLYNLSAEIGVSPWNWWADVPVQQHKNLYITAGRRVDAPKVKYRGIFINDEEPALGGWAREKFGGINHQFYEHVFELILRLKGNFLWPAMWGKSIYDDDPLSPKLAHDMGVVLSTSHHEPMSRAHVEWERYGKRTPWDYARNETALKEFWKQGIERMGNNESIITLAMRGDGDEPMTQDTATALLERIVRDQRGIIQDVTKRNPAEVPQVWALYKEVQDYYEQGMKVPDDVTLLFADDNWGNIRRVPKLGAKRAGGYGMYYHFDYVGGPRNYKWLNTVQVERVWEQMRATYQYGIDRIWIVNVGDIKPMEYPISFFMDYAWNPDAIQLPELAEYPARWAAQQFGAKHAKDIGEMLTRYTQYNARRKPEMLSPETYSLVNFREADQVVSDYNALAEKARQIGKQLPQKYQDAYYQLVQFPIEASANLNELYITAAQNKQSADDRASNTNTLADKVDQLFDLDATLTKQYHALGQGRWNHFMDQTHIGYTIWQQPDTNIKPKTLRVDLPNGNAAPLNKDVVSKEVVAKTRPTKRAHQAASKKLSRWKESDGYIAIEAAHYTRAINPSLGTWQEIPNLGKTLSSMAVLHSHAVPESVNPAARLEYDVTLTSSGRLNVHVVLLPTLNFIGGEGFKVAVSIDDGAPVVMNMHRESNGKSDHNDPIWMRWVGDYANEQLFTFENIATGNHTIKVWAMSPGLVIQRVVVATKPLPVSYLGPPESARN